MTDIITLAEENSFEHYGFAEMPALVPLSEVRQMCSADKCGQFNHNWACPPGCGTIEEAKLMISKYSKGLIVQSTKQLKDEFDYEGMQELFKTHKKRFESFSRQVKMLYSDSMALSAGACTICVKCTYPQKPCRFPSKRISSMEAYGLWVSDVCVKSGLEYNYGKNTMTYTSCVLYNEE